MGDSDQFSSGLSNNSPALELTGKIMVVAIIVLFMVVCFVFFLHLYAKWFWYSRQDNDPTTTTRRRRRRFDFAPGHQESVITALRRGLDHSVLKSIPVVVFKPKDFKEELECAVCLSEVLEGENIRFLPKCNHGFHVDCIDMWFQSHSTCPICRNPVSNHPCSSESTTPESDLMETVSQLPMAENHPAVNNFPTNVLYCGNEDQVSSYSACLEEGHRHQIRGDNSSDQPACSSSSSSSSSTSNNRPDGMLVIDIPRHVSTEDGEVKSPMITRLRSFKRLLSRVSPRNTSNVDVEQGSSCPC